MSDGFVTLKDAMLRVKHELRPTFSDLLDEIAKTGELKGFSSPKEHIRVAGENSSHYPNRVEFISEDLFSYLLKTGKIEALNASMQIKEPQARAWSQAEAGAKVESPSATR